MDDNVIVHVSEGWRHYDTRYFLAALVRSADVNIQHYKLQHLILQVATLFE